MVAKLSIKDHIVRKNPKWDNSHKQVSGIFGVIHSYSTGETVVLFCVGLYHPDRSHGALSYCAGTAPC